MKIKFLFLIQVMILWTGLTGLRGQYLVVSLNNGTEVNENLGDVRKLTFPGTDLLVSMKDGTTDSYGLSTVRKIYFKTNVSVDEINHQELTSLKVFPNPAVETLNITGIPKGSEWIRIYRADGQLLVSQNLLSDHIILDISTLAKGLYYICTENASAKFVKP